MPTFVLLGRDGRVLKIHPGFEASDQPEIESLVQAALDATKP
jgi:hypothetical protein